MSDLTREGLDPNVEENTGSFYVVPAGKYAMVMVNDSIADAKSGNGKVMTITFQIVQSGPENGNVLDCRLNIKNKSEIAERIGQGTLKRLCTLTDVSYPPKDTSRMYGKPVMGTIKVTEFTSNTTGADLRGNEITAFNPVSQQQSDPSSPPAHDNSDIPW